MSTYSYPPINAYLTVDGAGRAIDYYQSVFGAVERYRLVNPADGKIGHAELEIEGGVLMVADENPAWGPKSPKTLGGTPVSLNLMVTDADATFARAVAAGATGTMPPVDMFYGFRCATVIDPWGHSWMLQHKIREVPAAEMQAGWEQMLAEMCAGPGQPEKA